MRPTSLALGLASLLSVLAAAPLAQADSAGAMAPAMCGLNVASSSQGLRVPANAPALLVLSRSGNATAKDPALVLGETRTPLGAQVTDANGLLTLPLPELAPGTYSLEYGATCTDLQGGEEPRKVPLELTAPSPFPTSVGALAFTPAAKPTGRETVLLTPSPELRAFAAVAALEVTIDGGEPKRFLGLEQAVGSAEPMELPIATGDACIVDGALHRNKLVLQVSVGAVLAGRAERPAPATVAVPVDCGAIKWTDRQLTGENGGTTPSEEEGALSTPSSEASESETSASCSAAPAGRAGGATSFGALGLAGVAALVVARRRARR